jgi:integrase
MGQMLLEKVTAETLRSYRLWLERQHGQRTGRPLSGQSVRHILADARCFFRWCEDTGLIPKAPTPRRLLPRVQERPPDRLTDAEVERLVALPEPYGFVIRLSLGTGLRWGELCRARSEHIQNGMLVVSHTKSYKARRVPLTRELQEELRGRLGKLVPFSWKSNGSLTGMTRRLSGVEASHIERGGSLAALQQSSGTRV